MPSMMGSTLRRLKIYYINNFRASKLVWLVMFAVGAYLLFASTLFGRGGNSGGPKLHVRYKMDDSQEKMGEAEIRRYLDALEDTRPVRCRDQAYDFERLDVSETVSILMEFHGNEFNELKLTLSSVFEHTPYDLIHEVLILDDGTKDAWIRSHSAKFLQEKKYSKVKMYSSESHDGQASSRYKLSMVATGSILVFVGNSVVVNTGWLQPLVSKVQCRISSNQLIQCFS